MKRYVIWAAIVLAVAAVAVIGVQRAKIGSLTEQRDRYKQNQQTLFASVENYVVEDSLNAAKIGELELTLNEYKQYRAKDAEIIKDLRTRNRDLSAVTSAQSNMIAQLRGTVRDSLIIVNNTVVDTVQCVDIANKWYDLHGCWDSGGKFSGTFVSRDSLIIVETVKYKRFLGFLWKTKKIKNREYDIVSRNPYTQITGFEHITIRK